MSGIWGYFPDRFGPILLSAQNRSQNRQKIALTERVLDNEDAAFEIREPQDGDEDVENSVIMKLIRSRKELANDKLTKAKKDSG